MRYSIFISFLFLFQNSFAQTHSHATGKKAIFPDIPGYKTISTDLHQHTAFSDGSVWPDIRVQVALKDGIDAISLTEHLEYQPHKDDIPHPDRNRSYKLALKEAKDHNLIIIHGSEITRRMPPGHNNAVFIQDANKLLIADSMEIFREAKRQGAFVFWNHPNWIRQRKDGVATLTEMHEQLIKEKLLDGIEVVNDHTYSDEALQIALDNNLTIMGTSDIHGLIEWDFNQSSAFHRPVTLVFGKEKNAESIKEGLMNQRTVVFYRNLLIGRDVFLKPLISASLQIKSAKYSGNTQVLVLEIENVSSVPFTLQNKSKYNFHNVSDIVTVAENAITKIEIKTLQLLENFELTFEVLNAINAPNKHPQISLNIAVNK